ncbi:hypothetical protein U9M48_003026 [Paspalum notatum var. saurae]|uniref:Uncharacterized protein n=1 Tax=Paspalum notatum var. saurae TaxID=547442 RepID=A0AAQ3PKT0_PASNO
MAARIGARSGAPVDLAAAPGGPRLSSRGGALAALASARGGGAPTALATATPTVGSPALRWRASGGKARRGPEERRRTATRETRAFEESGEELSVLSRAIKEDELLYIRAQYNLFEPKAEMILEAITYRRMDFEEFRAATISPYQLEAAAQWKEIASCYAWQWQRWYEKENSELKLWLTNADMKWYKQENSELLATGVCCNAASVSREQREKMVAAERHKVDQRVKWITELKYKMQFVSIVQNKSSTLNLGPNVPLLNTGSFYKLFMLFTGKSQMRREQDRLARMDAHYQKRKEIAEFELRREERLEAAEERMAKKRLKRQKKQREERKAN